MPRYARVVSDGKSFLGRVTEDGIRPVQGTFETGVCDADGVLLPWGSFRFLPPVVPTKIVCVGRNYRAHAEELGNEMPTEPLLFLKPPSALIGHEGAIAYPHHQSDLVHHEGELAVIIGRRARHLQEADVPAHILGYSLANDVTARDLQRKDGVFTRGKGFDTFAPLGPWVDTDFEPKHQRVTVSVNDGIRQDAPLSAMVFGVRELVAFISRIMTLEPGDVVLTGTPKGVGPLVPGDSVVVDIEGLGTLSNTVVSGGR
jgi:2-keto-4-pentenoate hydratase/2-oxohepta-3-ene-1,7-dioic acid hydratase in catechol pathway